MQLSYSNNVKVINLNSAKLLPEWITEKKRRKLEKKDVDIRKRVQLLQNLEMPSVSTTVSFSRDANYLFATGSYKPTLKCFDLNELSLKFERGLDADVVKFQLLSDDYSKFILLEDERFVEIHTGYGRYFRLRIPHFGRDISFCREISEAYIAGYRNEIFRLNLELGRFHEPFYSQSDSLTCCQFNDQHQLFVCGTTDGKVEAWDYRERLRASVLDCVLNKAIALELDFDSRSSIEVSSLCFKDALHLAVGLSNGYILLYDIRSSQPYLTKTHNFGLPITCLEFAQKQELVLSMDGRALKIWNEHNGQPFTSIEPGSDLNSFAHYKDSGVIFFANDDPKIKQYFIPALGPAPKWCSHLESITEELEIDNIANVYDDFKFVTRPQMDELGLQHLIGTNAARAYMHGYFIEMKAYTKARGQHKLNAAEEYRERKLKEKLEKERQVSFVKRTTSVKLPKVNRELAIRLQTESSVDGESSENNNTSNYLLNDQRFSGLFNDPDFEIIEDSEQYKQLAPMMKRLDVKRKRNEKKLEENDIIIQDKEMSELSDI
ncbi:hypothetical protein Mgra_00007528 [Meloidogyne graminicola]|uniref:Nucleolar protein 10 n=1 Tax=Meloidogyne graminicola TaxID=189291 RepID=A0A8S9ZIE7_9BILA|nr:hypothetical protein Mgra_00007528 [Meloidogyne graminicola]